MHFGIAFDVRGEGKLTNVNIMKNMHFPRLNWKLNLLGRRMNVFETR